MKLKTYEDGRKEERELWITKFKEYSCIKNDKWFLDWIKEKEIKK